MLGVVDDFVGGRAKDKNIIGCRSVEELVDNLEKPRRIMLMIKAWAFMTIIRRGQLITGYVMTK